MYNQADKALAEALTAQIQEISARAEARAEELRTEAKTSRDKALGLKSEARVQDNHAANLENMAEQLLRTARPDHQPVRKVDRKNCSHQSRTWLRSSGSNKNDGCGCWSCNSCGDEDWCYLHHPFAC